MKDDVCERIIMSKRFTDTNKWNDPWFSNLSDGTKLLWLFILDMCNPAGIWEFNKKVVEAHLWEGVLNQIPDLGNRVKKIGENKYFIVKFIPFQYANLKPSVSSHRAIIKMLEKYGVDWEGLHKELNLTDLIQPPAPDGERDEAAPSTRKAAFDMFWDEYPKRSGKIAAQREFNRLKLWEKIDEVLDAVKKYRLKAKAPFILDPERWIKRGHWMDEDGRPGAESPDEAKARTERWINKTGGKR